MYNLGEPATVKVVAKVAFAAETPLAVAYGGITPPAGRRMVGDTVELHGPRYERMVRGGKRLVEVVVNGQPVASREVEADGKIHDLQFDVPHRSQQLGRPAAFSADAYESSECDCRRTADPGVESERQWCLDVIDLH